MRAFETQQDPYVQRLLGSLRHAEERAGR
jgi:hypothetical protein